MLLFVMTAAASLLLLLAAACDVATRRIPNRLSVALAVIGLLLAMEQGHAVRSVVVAALLFVLPVAVWLAGWMGGGDVKLIVAVSLCLSPLRVVSMLVVMALSGSAIACFYLVTSKSMRVSSTPERPSGMLPRVLRMERIRLSRGGPLPYAAAIMIGALVQFVLVN